MGFAIVYLATGNSEDAFWGQLLVVVVLAAGCGLYSLFRSHKARHRQTGGLKDIATAAVRGLFNRLSQKSTISQVSTTAISTVEPPIEQPKQSAKHRHDLKGGIELLARAFLVTTVERTNAADPRDVTMRCLCFAELVRRDELSAVTGKALTVYTLDEHGFYGKSIRCEAMKELATRTSESPVSENSIELPVVSEVEPQEIS